MHAKIEIACSNPDLVLQALKPDKEEINKFKVNLDVANNKVILDIEAEEMSGLLAGVNSYVRLIKTAKDAIEHKG